jgi:hypothetical protein
MAQAVTARPPRKFPREGWEVLGPLLARESIDYEAVDALLVRMADKWPPSYARNVVRAIREIESTGAIDLARYGRIEGQIMASGVVMSGRMRTATTFVRAAYDRWPVGVFKKTAGLLLPAPDVPVISALLDRPWLDLQIVDQRAAATFIVFCGIGHRFGVDLNVLDLWLRPTGANIIYLRDFNSALYLQGLKSLGDYRTTIGSLRTKLSELGTRKVVCIGYSGGVYGALLFGRDLPADLVLALSGPSTLDFGLMDTEDRPVYAKIESLKGRGLIEYPDLARDYAANKVRVRYLYAELNDFDRQQAEHLRACPGVTLEPLAGAKRHFILPDLIRRRQFLPLLSGVANST